jgi:hypothetical protein
VVVAVAEAEQDVADVDFARAAAAVDQAGFLERGLGGGPAGPGTQAGVGVALPLLPGRERGELDAGLVVVEDGGAGDIAQGAALRVGEDVQPRCDGPGFRRDPPQRQRAAQAGVVLGGRDGGRGARPAASPGRG